MNYTLPPPAKNKGIEVVQVTPNYDGPTVMFMGRFSAYDSNTRTYYLITSVTGAGQQDYILYSIDLNKLVVTAALSMTQAALLDLTSIEFDTTTSTLFGVFDTDMYTIDVTTAALTKRGPINGGGSTELVPSLTTAFDPASGMYFISVQNINAGTYNLLTYFTRNNSVYMTPNLQNGDHWTLYQMAYYAKQGVMLAYTQDLKGWPSIKTVDIKTGNHTDLISEFIWSDYDLEYYNYPLSPNTNEIVWLDPDLNIFWITVMYTDPENLEEYDAVVYYNLTKGGDEFGSGPMVIYGNALEFTNYVWNHW
jgi:hypothetical protein